MRIRKIKEKDIAGAVMLMRRSGISIDEEVLTVRMHDFQYKRNHTVVVVWYRGRLISLMHIGIEPSLTSNRFATVFSLFVDAENAPGTIEDNLLAYAGEWAKQHGCDPEVIRRDGNSDTL